LVALAGNVSSPHYVGSRPDIANLPRTRMTTELKRTADNTEFSQAAMTSVTCPNCNAKIPLSQALTAEAEQAAHVRMEEELHRRERAFQERAALEIATTIAQSEMRAREAVATKISDLEAELNEKTTGLDLARQVELDLRKRQRELEEKEKGLSLEIARRVDVERRDAEKLATERVTEEFRLKEAQSREQLAQMTRTIDDLKRKAEQGSMQTQGEALEVELEDLLRHAFPADEISPVSKGVRGADITHCVRTTGGVECATIVWETKNAKSWSAKWLEKIRENQLEAKASLAVIVTNTLPVGVRNIGIVEGIWVCDVANATVLALALRAQLHAVHREKTTAEGKATKQSDLFAFVTGTEFQQRIVTAVKSLAQMKKDVTRERNAALRQFAKRDQQIIKTATQVAEFFGGVQEIVGPALKPVELLELSDDDDEERDEEEVKLLPR
jgi:hypothetical protein